MIRSYSEAMAETVGSIMVSAIQKNRNPHPHNFEKEILLRFNLPSLEQLTDKFIPDLAEKVSSTISFHRKGDLDKNKNKRYKFFETSASIGNYRKAREERSHVPVSFFK